MTKNLVDMIDFCTTFGKTVRALIFRPGQLRKSSANSLLHPYSFFSACVMGGNFLSLLLLPTYAPLLKSVLRLTSISETLAMFPEHQIDILLKYPRPTLQLIGVAKAVFWVVPALLLVLALTQLLVRFREHRLLARAYSQKHSLLYYVGLRELIQPLWLMLLALCASTGLPSSLQLWIGVSITLFGRITEVIVLGVLFTQANSRSSWRREGRPHFLKHYVLYYATCVLIDVFHALYLRVGPPPFTVVGS